MTAIPDDKVALAMLKDRIAALEAENARMRAVRRDELRAAYKAGWQTRKIGGGLNEGWQTFAHGCDPYP